MWETLAQPQTASWIMVGVALGTSLTALRLTLQRAPIAAGSLLLSALPALVAAALGASEAADLTLAPEGSLAAADMSVRATIAAQRLGRMHGRLFIGQAATAAGLAWVGVVLFMRGRRSLPEHAPNPKPLALVWAACALLVGVAAYAAHARAGLLDALVDAPHRAYAAALTGSATTRERLQLLRAVLGLGALAIVLRAAAACGETKRERAGVAGALLLGLLVLQADVAVEYAASRRLAATFATPWTDSSNFEPILEADLRSEWSPGDAFSDVAVVLEDGALLDRTRGVALPSEPDVLAEALVALRQRLAEERERVAAAYEARSALTEPTLRDEERLETQLRQEDETAAPDVMGRLVERVSWTSCAPASAEHTLSVAVDRRASAVALRALVAAATRAGFGQLEFVMPLADPAATRALQARDAAGAALVGYPMRSVNTLLVGRCVASDVPFMTGVVDDGAPLTLRHSDGREVPVGDPPSLDALPDRPDLPATVVLALGPNATPVDLLRAVHAVEERLVTDTPLLVSAPSLLPEVAVPDEGPTPPEVRGAPDAATPTDTALAR